MVSWRRFKFAGDLGVPVAADVLERDAAQGVEVEGRRPQPEGHGPHHPHPQRQQRGSLEGGAHVGGAPR